MPPEKAAGRSPRLIEATTMLRSFPQELQEILVELLLVRVRDTVRTALVDDELAALDQPVCGARAVLDGDELVLVTVQAVRRHGGLLQDRPEVRLRERLDGIEGVLVTGLHALAPEGVKQSLRDFRAGPIESEERHRCDVEILLRTVLERTAPDAVIHLDRRAGRVVRCL